MEPLHKHIFAIPFSLSFLNSDMDMVFLLSIWTSCHLSGTMVFQTISTLVCKKKNNNSATTELSWISFRFFSIQIRNELKFHSGIYTHTHADRGIRFTSGSLGLQSANRLCEVQYRYGSLR